MSHDKRERGALADRLSGLTAADVAPGWEVAAAWQKLERRIGPAKRRRIPVRSYVLLAAAASISCCILLLRIPERPQSALSVTGIIPVRRQTTAAPSISNAALPVATAAVHNEAKAVQPVMHERNALIKIRQSLPAKDTLLPQPVAATIPEPAQKPVQYRVQRKPPIVYTLPEIMADVPEHAEAPKKYTKIFLFRPGRAPQREDRPVTRQSIAPEAYNPPSIID